VLDAGGERAHGGLDVLLRLHVLRAALRGSGEPVEQVGVDIVSDAEREYPRLAPPALRLPRDLLRVALAHGGQAIRHEQHDAQAAGS
jgi:hypothetical protein